HYEYSNVGFVTLGYAVVGQPGPPAASGYTGLLARTITEALGMRVTANQPVPGYLLARGYLKNGDALRLVQTRAANIHSSARDLLIWVKANLGLLDAAISPTLAAALALTHNVYFAPRDDQRLRFVLGLAWEIRNRRPESPAILTKNGATSTSAHSCAVAFAPTRQMGLAVLANSFGSGTDPTGLAVDVLRRLME